MFAALDSLKPEDVMQHGDDSRRAAHRAASHQPADRALCSTHRADLFLAKHLRSNEWKTLSIPRGKSEDYKTAPPKAYKPTKLGAAWLKSVQPKRKRLTAWCYNLPFASRAVQAENDEGKSFPKQ